MKIAATLFRLIAAVALFAIALWLVTDSRWLVLLVLWAASAAATLAIGEVCAATEPGKSRLCRWVFRRAAIAGPYGLATMILAVPDSFFADLRRTNMANTAATWLEGRLAWSVYRCHQLATQYGISVCAIARVLILGGTIAAIVVLAGCAAGPQEGSGQTVVKLTLDAAGNPTGLDLRDGKERGHVKASAKIGEKLDVKYEASDVRAFDGQALRARLEEIVAREIGATWRETAPGIVDALTRAAIDVLPPGAAPLLPFPLP